MRPDPGAVACVERNLERFRVDLQIGDEVLLAEQLIQAGQDQLLDPFTVAPDRRDPEGGQGGPDALGMLDDPPCFGGVQCLIGGFAECLLVPALDLGAPRARRVEQLLGLLVRGGCGGYQVAGFVAGLLQCPYCFFGGDCRQALVDRGQVLPQGYPLGNQPGDFGAYGRERLVDQRPPPRTAPASSAATCSCFDCERRRCLSSVSRCSSLARAAALIRAASSA